MPVTPIPEAAEVAVTGSILGQPWANVIGLDLGTGFVLDASAAQDIANAVRTLYADLAGVLVTGWTADAATVRDLRTTNALSYDPAWVTVVGTLTSDPMPPHVAVCCSHHTGLGGRSYRGRTYLAGVSEISCTALGGVDPSWANTVEGYWDDFRGELALIGGTGVSHAVISRKLLEANEVLTTNVDLEFDRQNRRKRRA